MSIYSGGGSISDGIDGTFPDASVEKLKIGIPYLDTLPNAIGTVAGFTSGGSNGSTSHSTIDTFPFSTFGFTATDVGDLVANKQGNNGHSSSTDGYSSGGIESNHTNRIEAFSFSISSGTATDVGDLTSPFSWHGSSSSDTDGFTSGGFSPTFQGSKTQQIEKFSFVSSVAGTDVGDLTRSVYYAAGQSSTTDGFTSGGSVPSLTNVIDKFPFSISSGTATDVGDLSVAREQVSGQTSTTDGFTSGGITSVTDYDTLIDKFPFAISSGTATDVGDLSAGRHDTIPSQSETDAIVSGGHALPARVSTVDKFPFAISSGTATAVGNLSSIRQYAAGHQD